MGGSAAKASSRALATSWPYPRYQDLEPAGRSVFELGDCEGRNPARDPSACHLHHLARELLFAREHHGTFVLLSGGRSPVLWSASTEPGAASRRGLMPFLLTLLPEPLRASVVPISVRWVVRAIEETGGHGDWVGEPPKKHGLERASLR